jgi:hypothetical protein
VSGFRRKPEQNGTHQRAIDHVARYKVSSKKHKDQRPACHLTSFLLVSRKMDFIEKARIMDGPRINRHWLDCRLK